MPFAQIHLGENTWSQFQKIPKRRQIEPADQLITVPLLINVDKQNKNGNNGDLYTELLIETKQISIRSRKNHPQIRSLILAHFSNMKLVQLILMCGFPPDQTTMRALFNLNINLSVALPQCKWMTRSFKSPSTFSFTFTYK